MASPGWSRNPKPIGASPTITTFRSICYVNKMDRSGANFLRLRGHDPEPLSVQGRYPCRFRSDRRTTLRVWSDLVENEGAGLGIRRQDAGGQVLGGDGRSGGQDCTINRAERPPSLLADVNKIRTEIGRYLPRRQEDEGDGSFSESWHRCRRANIARLFAQRNN